MRGYRAEREFRKRWDRDFGEGFRSHACECGAVKRPNKEACDTCTYLDGIDKRGELISFMRSVGGHVTIAEVAITLGRDPVAAYRSLRDLVRAGRAVERKELFEKGGGAYGGRQLGERNIYALIDRRR